VESNQCSSFAVEIRETGTRTGVRENIRHYHAPLGKHMYWSLRRKTGVITGKH